MIASAFAALALLSVADAAPRGDSHSVVGETRVAFTRADLSGTAEADARVLKKLHRAAAAACMGEARARSGGDYRDCRRHAFNDAVRRLYLSEAEPARR
jgi:UrcA family protein